MCITERLEVDIGEEPPVQWSCSPFSRLRPSQLRKVLTPLVAELLVEVGAPKGMRLGMGDASINIFASVPPRVGRACGGKLPTHRDYDGVKHSTKHSFNILLLLRDVMRMQDGPTYVYESSRLRETGRNVDRDLKCAGYRRRDLMGRCGDVFVFHAADYHGVAGIVHARGEAQDGARLRANLVLAGQHTMFDNMITVG